LREQFKISFKENTIISPRVIPLGFGVTIYIYTCSYKNVIILLIVALNEERGNTE
jgi:hypothetical protein